MLFQDTADQLRADYHELLKKSGFPVKGLTPDMFEVADFGLSRGEKPEFEETGLGIIVLVNKAECGKVLLFLPGQFLPEHRHQSVVAIPEGKRIPHAWVDMRDVVPGFEGLEEFPRGTTYIVPADMHARDFQSPIPEGTLIPGKQEYFHILHGKGSLFVPGDPAQHPWFPPPASRDNYVTARQEVRLTPGAGYHLDANTRHSVVAGPEGLVLLEFSLTSRDPLDIFTDPGVRRITEFKKR